MSNGANHLGGVLASGRGTPIRVDSDGEEYSTHLYVAEDTSVANIKLNGLEKKVIVAEEKRPDFRTRYHNPAKGTGALTLVHYYKGSNKPFYLFCQYGE